MLVLGVGNMFKKAVVVLLFLGNLSLVYANDDIPQRYTPNNQNPYKALSKSELKKLADSDKYDYMLSRLEREYFGKEFAASQTSERLERLEQHVFGTSFDENTKSRCDRLKQAFNAQKVHTLRPKNRFSGMPTSIPFGPDFISGN